MPARIMPAPASAPIRARCKPGEIYLALRGPRFDGNEFLEAAASAGAVAAVVDRPVRNAPLPLIEVDDGQLALTRAASNWRASFKGVVVGVAGSNGKTTVKEMTSRHPFRRGILPCHARQPQQPHRRAADAAAPDTLRIASPSSRSAPTGPAKSPRWSGSRVRTWA